MQEARAAAPRRKRRNGGRIKAAHEATAAPKRAHVRQGDTARALPRGETSTELTRRNATRRVPAAQSNPARAAATADARITRSAFRAQAMTVVTLALLAAAAAFSTQVMTDGEQPLEPLTISAGELSVRVPAGWQRTSLRTGRLGSLSQSFVAAPAGRVDIALTAGVIREPAATRRELRQLPPRRTRAASARLGRFEVSRYSGLRPRRGTTGTAYVLHTTGPSILIMCEAPAGGGRGPLRACGSAASTARVRGERPVSITVAQGQRSAVGAALADLRAERLMARRRIAAAEVADEQAAATRELQVSYEEAWGRVLEIDMPDAEAAGLLVALGDTAAAYGALATAISWGDQPGYDAAAAAVDQAEETLWRERLWIETLGTETGTLTG
jgi:hypothetical protein